MVHKVHAKGYAIEHKKKKNSKKKGGAALDPRYRTGPAKFPITGKTRYDQTLYYKLKGR